MRLNTLSRRLRNRGTTLVETAIVLSILLLFLMAIFEYGRFFLVNQMLANAARDGARYAATNVDKSNAFVTTDEAGKQNITAYVRGECRGMDTLIENFSVQVFACNSTSMYADPPVIAQNMTATSWKPNSFTERLAVEITGQYRPILPVIWLPTAGGGFFVNILGTNASNVVTIRIAAVSGSER
jgi:Flp pilus assembly protein TadG